MKERHKASSVRLKPYCSTIALVLRSMVCTAEALSSRTLNELVGQSRFGAPMFRSGGGKKLLPGLPENGLRDGRVPPARYF